MPHDIAMDALKALNEVLTVHGIPEVPVNHDIHARIGFWITRNTRRTSARIASVASTVRLDHARQVLQFQKEGAYFIRAKSEHWEVIGFDDFGTLHARSVNRGVNSVEQIDFRARLYPVLDRRAHTHLMQTAHASGARPLPSTERLSRGLSTAEELIARNS